MEIAPKIGQGRPRLRPTARTAKPAPIKVKERTTGSHRPAFLTQVFYPIMGNEHKELTFDREIEQHFYASFDNLCTCYGMKLDRRMNLPYPMNLAKCLGELSRQLKEFDRDLDLRLLQDDVSPARLSTSRRFSTGSTLFYIPIAPLFKMLENHDTKSTGELLLSMFSYLFRFVGVPHYAQDYSYLGGIYEMVFEWCKGEEDDPERDEKWIRLIDDHSEMIWERGAVCLMMLREQTHVLEFRNRVESYQPKFRVEIEFMETARGFLKLFEDFPRRNLHDRLDVPKVDDYEDFIRLEQYLHFFWDFGEPVHEEFMEIINGQLNECCEIEEPITHQYFDTPQQSGVHDHEFEKRLCELLHELIDNLIELNR